MRSVKASDRATKLSRGAIQLVLAGIPSGVFFHSSRDWPDRPEGDARPLPWATSVTRRKFPMIPYASVESLGIFPVQDEFNLFHHDVVDRGKFLMIP